MGSKRLSSLGRFARPILGPGITNYHAMVLAGAAAAALFVSSASADPLDLGVLKNYAVVDLGNGTTIGQNSGPVSGNEYLGNGVTAAFAGGGGGVITGKLYYDSTVIHTNTFSQLDTPPTTVLEPNPSPTAGLLSTAQSVSAYAAGLTATQAFSSTINGNGGLNVIDVADIHNVAFTISGTSADTFVFNVSDEFQTDVAMTLSGVSASQILFNFTATSGQVFNTSGGNTMYGTFLATRGGQFQFSNLNLTGELINTAGDVQLVSGSAVPTFTPFTPPTSVPLPAPVLAGGFLLGVFGLNQFRQRRARQLA
jgi:hypothetical protein